MSLTGPQVLQALDEALTDIRREEDEIIRKLGRGAERIAKIRENEGELLLHYAAQRLPVEQLAPLASAIEAEEAAAREVLGQRTAGLAAGAEQIAALDAEQSSIAARRAAVIGEIDRQQTALKGLSSRIAATIARDPRYEQQKQLAAQQRAVAAAARSKARQAEIDREQNARAYRADPLFTYLEKSGFGTDGYRERGFIAKLDARLAKFIGFAAAQRHYQMLNALPALFHAHADRQAAQAVAADDAIDEIERAAIDAAGGSAAQTALGHAQAEIAAIDARIAELQEQRNTMTAAQTQLAQADDASLERILAGLIRTLGAPDIQSLIAAARAAGAEDPVILQLDDARQRIGEERVDTHDHQARLKTLAVRRHELEDIEAEFKALKYDDPRSLFRDEGLITHELNNFLTGATPADAYWSAFRRSQSWSVGTSDWGGGIGLPRRGRMRTESDQPHEPLAGRPWTEAAGTI